ncbi:hypothetical protein DFP94_10815 [Fontibacillus phaseoli]|uniref:Uncharacterized protein n=1 Tax=Fontibacillus phaseoli TaxID=1416533 RepID=A0A369BAX0_9BACL|nr:hypothetical protein [Fontibacillus phaseoli]RCX17657.1 hypothetical protein DFP94_10815 [Fontibacillus phaseoli]
MNELERLLQVLFPENLNSKTLRLKRNLEHHFQTSIKELTKQGISYSDAFAITLEKLGGTKKINKLIKKSSESFFTSKYFIVLVSLLLGYPLIVYIIFEIFSIEEFPLLLFIPFLIGIAMLIGKLNAVSLDAKMNRFNDLNKHSDNTTVFSGGGIKYKEKK